MKVFSLIALTALVLAGCHHPTATTQSSDDTRPVEAADTADNPELSQAPQDQPRKHTPWATAQVEEQPQVEVQPEAKAQPIVEVKPQVEAQPEVKVEVKPTVEPEVIELEATDSHTEKPAAEVVEAPASDDDQPVIEADSDESATETTESTESSEETKPEVVETVPAGDETVLLGRRFFAEGDLRNARQAFTLALSNDLSWEEEREALQTLELINVQLLGSTGPDGDLVEYVVKRGDTLAGIANAYSTTWQMVQRLNGLNTQVIRVGQRLNVPRAPFSLIVRKDKFVMDLLIDGEFVKRYKVGLGKGDSTPLGSFKIFNRIPKPADGSYPYGHPEHRLGTHWMGVKGADGYQGYGIHGCRVEEYDQLGGECSRGCVRVTNEDAEELFSILPIGTQVTIVE